jgi:hypothetical protein
MKITLKDILKDIFSGFLLCCIVSIPIAIIVILSIKISVWIGITAISLLVFWVLGDNINK